MQCGKCKHVKGREAGFEHVSIEGLHLQGHELSAFHFLWIQSERSIRLASAHLQFCETSRKPTWASASTAVLVLM